LAGKEARDAARKPAFGLTAFAHRGHAVMVVIGFLETLVFIGDDFVAREAGFRAAASSVREHCGQSMVGLA